MLDGFICDTCGFTSSEEVGTGNTYYCPKCGNKMRRSTHGGVFGGGDANASKSVMAWDLMYLIFVGGLSFGVMNYISYWTDDAVDIILLVLWIVLFFVSLILFHNAISGSVSNKAIKANPTKNNPIQTNSMSQNNNLDIALYCTNCGQKLKGNPKFCPNCGRKIQK